MKIEMNELCPGEVIVDEKSNTKPKSNDFFFYAREKLHVNIFLCITIVLVPFDREKTR